MVTKGMRVQLGAGTQHAAYRGAVGVVQRTNRKTELALVRLDDGRMYFASFANCEAPTDGAAGEE